MVIKIRIFKNSQHTFGMAANLTYSPKSPVFDSQMNSSHAAHPLCIHVFPTLIELMHLG